jgi:2-iminoacetate synthase ThiH
MMGHAARHLGLLRDIQKRTRLHRVRPVAHPHADGALPEGDGDPAAHGALDVRVYAVSRPMLRGRMTICRRRQARRFPSSRSRSAAMTSAAH